MCLVTMISITQRWQVLVTQTKIFAMHRVLELVYATEQMTIVYGTNSRMFMHGFGGILVFFKLVSLGLTWRF